MQAEWGQQGGTVPIDPAPQHGEPPLFCAHLQGFSPGSIPTTVSPPGKSGSESGSPKELRSSGSPSSPSPPPPGKDKSTIILEARAALVDVQEVILSEKLFFICVVVSMRN